jgi:hypothetical protein
VPASRAGICPANIVEQRSSACNVCYYQSTRSGGSPEGTTTHTNYVDWLKHKPGKSKRPVKRDSGTDFTGTPGRVFSMKVLWTNTQSRCLFQMIDVDHNDRTLWLQRTTADIGCDAVELIVETKNGCHANYRPRDTV